MAALFGDDSSERLRLELRPMSPSERESTIVNELAFALKGFGHRFVLPFCFKNESGKRTTHHLIFVSKNFKGYEVMKGIMAQASSSGEQGVPSFVYSPADSRRQQLLFELNRPLDDLRSMLLEDFAGNTLTMKDIYMKHSVDRPYLKKHYKEVLVMLEQDGLVSTSGRKSKRGFADYIRVKFPE